MAGNHKPGFLFLSSALIESLDSHKAGGRGVAGLHLSYMLYAPPQCLIPTPVSVPASVTPVPTAPTSVTPVSTAPTSVTPVPTTPPSVTAVASPTPPVVAVVARVSVVTAVATPRASAVASVALLVGEEVVVLDRLRRVCGGRGL